MPTLEYIKVNIACADQIQTTSVYVVEVGSISHLPSEKKLFHATLSVVALFWDTYHSEVPGITPLEFMGLPYSL